MKSTECLIIGAGCVGSFAAYFLASQGKEVTVVDERVCSAEASGVSAGNLDILKLAPHMIPYAMKGIRLWEVFQNHLNIDVGFHRIGGVHVAFNRSEAEAEERQRAALRENDIAVERVSGDEIKERFPYLSGNIIEATYSPVIGYADPNIAGPNVLWAARKKGAEFYPKHKVTQMSACKSGGYDVRAGELDIRADKVLVCCGVRTPDLMEPFSCHIPLTLKKFLMTVTEKAPAFMTELVTGNRLSMKQTVHGSVLIGGGWEGYGDLKKNIKELSHTSLCGNMAFAEHIVPQLAKINVLRCWEGFDGFLPEKVPLRMEVPYYKGLYVAVTGSVGFTVSPFVGQAIAELMCR